MKCPVFDFKGSVISELDSAVVVGCGCQFRLVAESADISLDVVLGPLGLQSLMNGPLNLQLTGELAAPGVLIREGRHEAAQHRSHPVHLDRKNKNKKVTVSLEHRPL